MTFHFEEGEVLLIDKPIDWTSFDMVNYIRLQIRKYYGIKKIKVGHAGTLDPLATGLLILCTGKMTKQIDNYQAQDKVYTGTIKLGVTTPTYDLESEPDKFYPTEDITPEQIDTARQKFVGNIEQIPPIYSAIKVDGKRAFDYARNKENIRLTPRSVQIDYFEIDTSKFPDLSFKVKCSKGTYIRSLVHDFGKELQNGACLTSLRRTDIGDFSVENAWTLDELKQEIANSGIEKQPL